MPVLVEAAVEALEAALAAAAGGAQRIELCADLAHGGTTADAELLNASLSRLQIPVFVLVRPRPGDFVYSLAEHRTMLRQIDAAKAAGAAGIVTGALTSHRSIDEGRLAELKAAARPLPFTFHRAFDECPDLTMALETLVRHGVDRVLTSGGAKTAALGAPQIARLVKQARGRIGILPGGGIDASNVAGIVASGVSEVHFSVQTAQKVTEVLRALTSADGKN